MTTILTTEANMTYTAAEMREVAEQCKQCAYASDEYGDRSAMERFATIEAMLRQAAEAMEKDERRKSLDELAALSQELGLYDIQTPATTKEGE